MNQDTAKKTTRDPLSEQWIDLRLIAGMRVVLGTSALLVVLIEPIRNRWALPTYVALVLYSLYGLVVYHLSVRRNPLVAHKVIPWLDLCGTCPSSRLRATRIVSSTTSSSFRSLSLHLAGG